MKQSTISTTPYTANCLNFECGDFKLNIPESAMNDQFKANMGIVSGLAIGGAVIIFSYELAKMLNTRIPAAPQPQYPMYYIPQQQLIYYPQY